MSTPPEAELEEIVVGRDLSIAYGGLSVLNRVDLDIPARGEVVISGRSGSGKTSLLLVLAGLVPPSGGSVVWPTLHADQAIRRGEIAMVFQAPSLIPELTAGENVCLPLRLRGQARDDAAREAAEALARVGLDEGHSRVLPSEMSGGEQQRVSVARALAIRPRFLLADEPTGALDRANGAVVIAALREAVRRDASALLVATHDEDVAAEFSAHMTVEDRKVRWVRR